MGTFNERLMINNILDKKTYEKNYHNPNDSHLIDSLWLPSISSFSPRGEGICCDLWEIIGFLEIPYIL